MRIKASEMERMFHMSANGIRLYEKHGIIRPERGETSSYRLFGVDEMQAMGCGIQLRRYGFSMPETARLLGGADEAEQMAAMESRIGDIEREIEDLRRIRKSLRINAERAKRASQLLNSCVIEEKPAMYFLGSWRGEQRNEEMFDRRVGEWIDRYAPHLSAAVLLDGPYFLQDGYMPDPLSGIAADADVVLEMGLLSGSDLIYLPPRPCLVTAVQTERMPSDMEKIVDRVKRCAREKGVTLQGGAVMRLVQCTRRENGKLNVTALLWAPLAHDDKHAGDML